jgi:hypothetical protein
MFLMGLDYIGTSGGKTALVFSLAVAMGGYNVWPKTK